MDSKNAEQKILEAEILRERGETYSAAQLLTEIIRDPKSSAHEIATALGHRIVCFKHLYEAGRHNISLLHEMIKDAERGINLDIPESAKAVFYLRLGDANKLRGEYRQAQSNLDKAYQLVEKGGREDAEYLGHLADAVRLNGDPQSAVQLFDMALALMNLRKVREQMRGRAFHRHIIIAGLLLLKSKALVACKPPRESEAKRAYWQGYLRALWLELRYHMPQRMNQFRQSEND